MLQEHTVNVTAVYTVGHKISILLHLIKGEHIYGCYSMDSFVLSTAAGVS